jgi:hypothetical protein
MNESRKLYDTARLDMALKAKKAPAAGTADALSAVNESASIIASPDAESKAFAFIADPYRKMPRTFEERGDHYRSTGAPEHSAIQLGAKLAKEAIQAIINREMADAINHCAEEDLLLIVEAMRLNRELHGEDSCQTGNLTGAILQVLGFGAGYVARNGNGELEVCG